MSDSQVNPSAANPPSSRTPLSEAAKLSHAEEKPFSEAAKPSRVVENPLPDTANTSRVVETNFSGEVKLHSPEKPPMEAPNSPNPEKPLPEVSHSSENYAGQNQNYQAKNSLSTPVNSENYAGQNEKYPAKNLTPATPNLANNPASVNHVPATNTATGAAPAPSYSSSAISTAKTARKEDPFAEQNQRRAEKETESKKKRKQAYIGISVTLVCLAIIAGLGIAIWIFTHQNVDSPDIAIWNNGEAEEIQNKAEELYKPTFTNNGTSTEGDTQAVTDYFEEQLSQASDDIERVNTVLIEMRFYADNGRPDLVIESSKKINIDMMSDFQIADYSGMLFNAYLEVGDSASANYYMQLMEDRGLIVTDVEEGAG